MQMGRTMFPLVKDGNSRRRAGFKKKKNIELENGFGTRKQWQKPLLVNEISNEKKSV